MRRRTVRILAVFLLLCCIPSGGRAVAEADDDLGSSTPGSLSGRGADGTLLELPLRHTRVEVEISSFVARTVIEQTFRNPFQEPIEAIYTFPLGDRAAVDDFELVVGNRTIRGEIRRREEARREYEAARTEGYGAALLEQERPNVFTQSVANLEPGGEVRVRLRTIEVLAYEAGTYRFTFPLVVGPRYVPGGKAVVDGSTTRPVPPTPRATDSDRVTPPVLTPGFRSGHDVEISVAIEAGVPIGEVVSPSHRVLTRRPNKASCGVRLAPDDRIPNKDFLLRWNVASESPAVGLLANRKGVDGFFALLVQPKEEVSAEEATPKDLILVLDTSGSMRGVPLDASRRFAAKALRTLGRRDNFNLIRFSGSASGFEKEPVANGPEAVARALLWLEGLEGSGGTEMLAGFRAAFERPADPDRLRMVVFLTDGYIGNEGEILEALSGVVGRARVYTLGIGSAVNHFLLDRMADIGRGAYVFVRPDEGADAALDRFRAWVTRPYLTDLEVDWGALPVADIVPERPRDLSSGQTLRVVGRYVGAGEGNIVVRGRLAGRSWEQALHVVLPEQEESNGALAAVWARHRIEELLLASPGVVPSSVEAEVTALALEHRLLSAYTSFVAVDDSRIVNPEGPAETVRQPLPIPEGVSFEGVFGAAGPCALREGGSEVECGDRISLPEGASIEEIEVITAGAATEFKKSSGSATGTVVGGLVGGVLGGLATDGSAPAGGFAREMSRASRADETARGGSWPASTNEKSLPVQGPPPGNAVVPTRGAAPFFDRAELLAVVGGATSNHLREHALRILADLAEDRRLSPSEGMPALAALLAAQARDGSFGPDVTVHALCTWAFAEAAATLRDEPWIKKALEKARAYLASLERAEGWPRRGGGETDPIATRLSSLALGRERPAASDAGVTFLRNVLEIRSDWARDGLADAARRLLAAVPRKNLALLR